MTHRSLARSRFPYRWRIVALLFFLSAINYLDRQTLSVLAKTVREVLGFTPVEYSYIVTGFLVAYATGYLFCGRVVDRIGVRLAVIIALSAWSLAAMGHALATGWMALLAWRFALGLGESFNAPCGVKALAEWAPKRERGLSIALFSNGNMLGAVIAPPLVAALAGLYGWQWAFVITGSLGFVYLIFWSVYYEAPERQPRLPAAEREYILAERSAPEAGVGTQISFRQALRHPAMLGFFVARFLTDSISFFFSFWLPEYLQTARGFSLAMVGVFAWMPFLASDIGGPGGGALSDWLVRRGWNPSAARRRVMLVAACLMPCSVVAVQVPSAYLALALIGIVLAAQSCWMANQLTLLSETFPREHVATYLSLSSVGGAIGGILSTLAAGRIIHSVGYGPVFVALGFLHFLAYAAIVLGTRRARRDRPSNPQVSGATP
jgi:ACS family hexuronate transporter-like MFS transporter